jgi:hypothetical protein
LRKVLAGRGTSCLGLVGAREIIGAAGCLAGALRSDAGDTWGFAKSGTSLISLPIVPGLLGSASIVGTSRPMVNSPCIGAETLDSGTFSATRIRSDIDWPMVAAEAPNARSAAASFTLLMDPSVLNDPDQHI